MSLISLQNVNIEFEQNGKLHTAVQQSNFEIEEGKIIAVVGESGSGKSVTALALMGLLPTSAIIKGNAFFEEAGRATVNLLSLNDIQWQQIRGKKIAMIFQEPMTSLNPAYTCGNQVQEAIILHKKIKASAAKKETIDLFRSVELPEPEQLFSRYPHELSGGQRQRVMIAMAISCDPKLLIADEPTTALDVSVQKSVLGLLKKLQRSTGMSILLITHDLGLVADVADKVIVMFKGNIVEQGYTETVLKNSRHPYTKALLACRPAANDKNCMLPIVSDVETSLLPQARPENVIDYSDTFLQVKDLSVKFPIKKNFFGKTTQEFVAVNNVSFNIFKNETLGLVGESGCGKTTLGRTILQLIPANSGSIILNGKDLTTHSATELKILRKEIQIVFQDPFGSLNPRLQIGEAIAEPIRLHGIENRSGAVKERVAGLLEDVGLEADHFNRYPHQFSGGQRQRICIARALALEPKFLVFDESVSALDVSVQAQVLNLINDLKVSHGFTSLFISHDLSVVHYLCDRILVMRKGKIIEEGSADDIFYRPKNNYTKSLIEAIPGRDL